jgi:superfamily II DNA or RNA helicase
VEAETVSSGGEPRLLDGLELRDWQAAALAAWAANGCTGVIEAVTGTGKTRLALAATRAMLSHGARVLVLVPTLELMDQWIRRLREHVPGVAIGRLGGGGDDDLHDRRVLVSTPHSAARLPIDLPAGAPGLLIADEAHRYGAPTWGSALKDGFAARLALTATYERTDDGLVDVLGPYFGPVVHSYTFADAARDGTIAPFRIGFVATPLTDGERASYDRADAQLRQARRALVDHGLPRDPLKMIAAASALVSAQSRSTDDPRLVAARGFLSAMRVRRDVAAGCAGKLDVVVAAASALRGGRTLVFTDTIAQAGRAARLLTQRGLAAEEVHGELDSRRRRIRLAQFARGNLEVLVAPRVLDEGVDVPDADVAIVLAYFRTRRQMIQRLGRVLRTKPDGREARLLVAYADGTREDPDEGAHEDFLGEIVPVAREIARLDVSGPADAIPDWLATNGGGDIGTVGT